MLTDTNHKRNILLCVAGMTPQIITETLYALTQKHGERVDEIRVITTLEGRNKVLQSLLDKQNGKFFELCRDFGIAPESIKFDETTITLLRTRDGRTLEDIRLLEENELAGDQICEIVRELCKDKDLRIHASAAGGRKTMSIYLTAAMQMFGRAGDTLSHVLVSADFETHPQFFYPPPTPQILKTKDGRDVSTDDAKIYLAMIPFIRLCGVSAANEQFGAAHSYNEMVAEAQTALDIKESDYGAVINLGKRTVTVNRQTVKLAPREIFFYAMFAEFRKQNPAQTAFSLHKLRESDFHQTFERIMQARGENVGWEEVESSGGFEFAQNMLTLLKSWKRRKNERDFEDFRNSFSVMVTRMKNKFRVKGVHDARYFLVSTDDGTASYSLAVKPERIKFET